ncbi:MULTISPECIES: GDSL-type esterase/lipase family protein [Bacteria]|uniref:GDSL-type esterase/lipase family protein n=1 Tax=Bacteria TaxID=2 RepID=UPI003C7AC0F6
MMLPALPRILPGARAGEDVPLSTLAEAMRGALSTEVCLLGLRIRRLPRWTAAQYGDDRLLDVVSRHGSGVRLELETAASWIELDCRWDVLRVENAALPHPVVVVEAEGAPPVTVPLEPGFGVDLLGTRGEITHEPGEETRMRLDLPGAPGRRAVTVWLPPAARAVIAHARSDAPLVARARTSRRWVHYGSSISHCLDAHDPRDVWPVAVARRLGVDLVNLGLAGEAHLDPFVARAIRDAAPDVITLKVGINIVGDSTMKARTLRAAMHGFLDTLREGLPATPITVISPVFCPDLEAASSAPGPREDGIPARDDRLTIPAARAVLREVVAVRSADDGHLAYLDGTRLLDAADADLFPDRIHPSPAGYRRMAERFLHANHLPGFVVPPRPRSRPLARVG